MFPHQSKTFQIYFNSNSNLSTSNFSSVFKSIGHLSLHILQQSAWHFHILVGIILLGALIYWLFDKLLVNIILVGAEHEENCDSLGEVDRLITILNQSCLRSCFPAPVPEFVRQCSSAQFQACRPAPPPSPGLTQALLLPPLLSHLMKIKYRFIDLIFLNIV